jgi:hypothetical protein
MVILPARSQAASTAARTMTASRTAWTGQPGLADGQIGIEQRAVRHEGERSPRTVKPKAVAGDRHLPVGRLEQARDQPQGGRREQRLHRVDVSAYRLTLKAERGGSMGGELQGAGGYRVGDADRNRTAELLKEAHAVGYLTLEEADERLGTALAARTRGELDRLVADLPPEWRASQERGQRPAGPPPRQRSSLPPEAAWLVPLVVVITGVILLAVLTRGFWFFPWPLLWIFFFAFGRRGRAGWRPPRW